MASPIVGALFLGMVSAGPGQAVPAKAFIAQGIPTPQCVVCGPANRRTAAGTYRWSRDHAEVQYQRLSEKRFLREVDGGVAEARIGISDEQAQRLYRYAGV